MSAPNEFWTEKDELSARDLGCQIRVCMDFIRDGSTQVVLEAVGFVPTETTPMPIRMSFVLPDRASVEAVIAKLNEAADQLWPKK